MKKWVSVLAAVFVSAVLLSACGNSGNMPAEPGEQSKTVYEEEAQHVQGKKAHEWIEEILQKEGNFTSRWGDTVYYDYHIPQILADGPGAEEINQDIRCQLNSIVENSMNDMEIGETPIYQSILWNAYLNKDILSLVIQAEVTYFTTEYFIYNYDIESGEVVDNYELLKRSRITEKDFQDAVRRAAAQIFDQAHRMIGREYIMDVLTMRASVLADSSLDMDKLSVFLGEEGELMTVGLTALAEGRGYDITVLEPDFSKGDSQAETADYSFIHAELKKNKVFLAFESTEDSEKYLSPEVQYDTPYEVDGLYGTYVDLHIGNIGKDFSPYLFLTDTNGQVSFCNIIGCAQSGDYFSAVGPILDLEKAVDYENQENQVLAVTEDGVKQELAEVVLEMENLIPYIMEQSSWIGEDGISNLFYYDDVLEWGVQTLGEPLEISCRGTMRYAGMNGEGMIFTFVFQENGRIEQGGLCILQHQTTYDAPEGEHILKIRHLSGKQIPGLQPGESLKMIRSWG